MRPGQVVAVAIVILVAIGLTTAAIVFLPGGEPSPTASPSVVASTEPTLSAIPPSPSEPVAGCDDSAHEAGIVVLRVEHITDTGRDWVISLYDDGRILSPGTAPYEYADDAWMIVRRLTSDGSDLLVSEVGDTGLFDVSASYNPVPLPGVEPPGRGGSGYIATLVRGTERIEVGWTSLFGDDELYYEPSPEREQLDALGAHLVALDEWLPSEAWADRDPCIYLAQQFEVIVETPQPFGGSPDDYPADLTEVEWPPGGDILTWGEPFSNPFTDPDIDGRCGRLGRDEAAVLVTDLLAAGADIVVGPDQLDIGPFVLMRLGYEERVQVVDVSVRPLLPDASACTDPVTLIPFGI